MLTVRVFYVKPPLIQHPYFERVLQVSNPSSKAIDTFFNEIAHSIRRPNDHPFVQRILNVDDHHFNSDLLTTSPTLHVSPPQWNAELTVYDLFDFRRITSTPTEQFNTFCPRPRDFTENRTHKKIYTKIRKGNTKKKNYLVFIPSTSSWPLPKQTIPLRHPLK